MKQKVSWMIRAKSLSSPAMTQTQKTTSFTIQTLEKQSSVEMSYLTRKENGLGGHVMKTTPFSHTLKKK